MIFGARRDQDQTVQSAKPNHNHRRELPPMTMASVTGTAGPRNRQMPRKPLGHTGLTVSVLGFGGAVIGIKGYLRAEDPDDDSADRQAGETVAAAFAAGINLFDTAPGYGAGRSENVIGRALEAYRSSVLLTTKVGVHIGQHPADWNESLHTSLERLRTDHVDLLQLHGNTWTDESVDWVLDEPAEWLADVKRRGLARSVGITAEAPSGALEVLLRSGRFDVLQIAYSVIYQDPCDYQREPFGVIPLAKALGIGVLTMRTTTSGVLHKILHAEFPELESSRISRLAIKFVLSTPQVDCALVGMSRTGEVTENCALATDLDDRLDLRQIHDFFPGRAADS
jgi:aryl-alcohol dehydrogenase-like predicted oxidoreductase